MPAASLDIARARARARAAVGRLYRAPMPCSSGELKYARCCVEATREVHPLERASRHLTRLHCCVPRHGTLGAILPLRPLCYRAALHSAVHGIHRARATSTTRSARCIRIFTLDHAGSPLCASLCSLRASRREKSVLFEPSSGSALGRTVLSSRV